MTSSESGDAIIVAVPIFLNFTRPLSSTVATTLPCEAIDDDFTEYTVPKLSLCGVVIA